MTKRNKRKKNLVLLSVLFGFSALVVFYFFQVVKISETGYLMGKKMTTIENLKKENAELKLSISQQRNLKNAEEKIIEEGFQKVSISTRNYIVIPEVSLAKK
ncbi:MAG: hypothetical protein WC446_02090 [Candidatus Paceibacterota bacterium]|jgi:hypothetical protein